MVRILFVCTGNTCRSPMAEAILKGKQLPEVEVKSAGTHAIDRAQISQHSLDVINENALVAPQQATLLTDEQVDWATHIITMTTAHKLFIINSFPQANKKTFSINEFTGEGGDVTDPFGRSKEFYEKTYNDLNNHLFIVVEKIKELMGEYDG